MKGLVGGGGWRQQAFILAGQWSSIILFLFALTSENLAGPDAAPRLPEDEERVEEEQGSAWDGEEGGDDEEDEK